MLDIKTLLILIPALPLVAAGVTAALGKSVLRERSHVPAVTAVLLSFIASLLLIFQIQEQITQQAEQKATAQPVSYEKVFALWTWVDLGVAALETTPAGDPSNHATRGADTPARSRDLQIDIILRADPLTAAMLAIVTCISSLVAIYAIGYMRGDPGYWRFFTYVSLFVFAMTMLVTASNFVLLYAFWEMVGLCSYLLIGFWYEKPAAATAGKKAFLVNRLGDCGFLLGIFFIWDIYGTLDFTEVFAAAKNSPGDGMATAICLLLLLGACGKSAQFPLHVWLPDAMEGPTPVSALIHAATMVTAGVYMVARCTPLFLLSPDAQHVVAMVGGLTALLGGIIAVTQTDLKRILAYSTISHLGYMFLALGAGTLLGITAGMFHLLTHAFFKALLFLGAGSVMHAMGGVLDIHRLGGLRRRLPITYATFLIGCLTIAGVAPLAGFWSKDAILLAVHERAADGSAAEMYELLFATAALGILLIDFYMFRPFFLVFHGPEQIPPEAGDHAHESPGTMTGPLLVLAFGSVVVGAYFEWTHGFSRFLAATPALAMLAEPSAQPAEHGNIGLMSTAITLVGILAAALVYLGNRRKAARLARLMNVFGLYALSYGKFFFDPIYALLVVWPLLGIARLAAWFDSFAIDGLVDLVGGAPKRLGEALRPLQNGLVQFYALAMMLGLLILIGILLI
jgi:NADH-quinone oxidoreductase subunit L